VRLINDSRNLNTSTRQVDHEQDVVAYQPSERHDLDGEEVHRGDGAPMRTQEGAPRRALASLRRGIQACLEQDAFDRIAADVIT
jgi:hypothetical protein